MLRVTWTLLDFRHLLPGMFNEDCWDRVCCTEVKTSIASNVVYYLTFYPEWRG